MFAARSPGLSPGLAAAWGVILAAALHLLAGQALAQEPEPGAYTGQDAFLEGEALLSQGRPVQALVSFRRALVRERRAGVHLQMARAYLKLRRPDRALHHFKQHVTAWTRENTGSSPHALEVEQQVHDLQQLLGLVDKGETRLAAGETLAAQQTFKVALARSAWSRIHHGLARCYHRLGLTQRALAALELALGSWSPYLSAPGPAGDPDRREAQARSRQLRDLEQRILLVGRQLPAPAAAAVDGCAPEPTRRQSQLWLVLGVSAASLVVGGEIMAWISFAKGNETYSNDPELSTHKAIYAAGHAMAGVMALASALSFYKYATPRSPRRVPAVSLVPLRGGGALTAGSEF